ncbi:MAG: ATPase [Limnochordales bacterium]|nr:ATPase [Limnochordales bacterium]
MAENTTAPVRHLFAGNNTPQGFFSYYEYLIPASPRRVFVLKGGPGTGKSTFMRRIGEKFNWRGWTVEYFHCSSDPDSLDGILFPEIGIAIVDGTAPHVIDPRFPGAVDEIINLGEFWDEAMLAASRDEITLLTREISSLFARAYWYLRAALLMREEQAAVYEQAMDHAFARRAWARAAAYLWEAMRAAGRQSSQLPGADTPKEGRIRRLFATAITPSGYRSFLPDLFGGSAHLVVVRGAPGTGKSTLVARLADFVTAQGYDCELYCDALRPERPEHIWIPALKAGVVTSTAIHPFPPRPNDLVIDLDGGLDTRLVQSETAALETARRWATELSDLAIAHLKQAKHLHDRLEAYYVHSMNFPALERLQSDVEGRILAISDFASEEASPGKAK